MFSIVFPYFKSIEKIILYKFQIKIQKIDYLWDFVIISNFWKQVVFIKIIPEIESRISVKTF